MKNLLRIILGKKPVYKVPYWKDLLSFPGSVIHTESIQYKWLMKHSYILNDHAGIAKE